MNKLVFGLVLGGVLGIFDGLTAWFTPEVRAQLLGIVIGSTFKGVIAGAAAGYFAKKVHSLPLGILFGLGVGLLLAYLVAAMPDPTGKHYYFQIMLPGSILGAVVGYATQRYKEEPAAAANPAGAR
jgi:MFS family permease